MYKLPAASCTLSAGNRSCALVAAPPSPPKPGTPVPATVYFEEHEWQALVAFVTRQPEPPQTPPTLREAVRMVAGLAELPGTQKRR